MSRCNNHGASPLEASDGRKREQAEPSRSLEGQQPLGSDSFTSTSSTITAVLNLTKIRLIDCTFLSCKILPVTASRCFTHDRMNFSGSGAFPPAETFGSILLVGGTIVEEVPLAFVLNTAAAVGTAVAQKPAKNRFPARIFVFQSNLQSWCSSCCLPKYAPSASRWRRELVLQLYLDDVEGGGRLPLMPAASTITITLTL